jgi:energy-converting hydrogenase Eha subunit G
MLKAFTIGLFHARITIKNSFGILIKMFKESFIKSTLNVLFLLDVVICCCMLHNMILNGKDKDVDELMLQLKVKNVPKYKKVWRR